LQVRKQQRVHEEFNEVENEIYLEKQLAERNEALAKGNIAEVVKIDEKVTKETLPGEWDEFKRKTNKEAAAALEEAKKTKGKKTKEAKSKITITPEEQLKANIAAEKAALEEQEKLKAEEAEAEVEELTLDNMFKLEELSPQQRLIFDFIQKVATEGDVNDYYTVVQTKGKVDKSKGWAATKIAKELGLPGKGNVINQIKRINEKARAIYGKDVDDLMIQMAQKEKDAGEIQQITSETDLEAEFEAEAIKEFEAAKMG
jgi:hypothetical protein